MAQSFSSSVFHRVRAGVLPRAQRLARRGFAALRAWVSPAENPFLQKALRLETRKHKPLFSVGVVALLCVLVCVFIWRLWRYLQLKIEAAPRTAGHRDLVGFHHWLIGVFGKHPLGWFALITALLCACGVLWSARSRSAYLLRSELLKNTLVQLQELPIAEERWLWQMAAQPAILGMLIGACGLPVFLLAVFCGLWNPLDIVGLFLLFFLLGHNAPSWMPAAWQQQISKTKPRKTTWNLRRAAQDGDSNLQSEYSTDSKINANARGGFSAWWGIAAFNFVFQLSKGIGMAPFQVLIASWPREAVALLPAFPITWPLLFSKLSLSPLPFFALWLPPVFLILPIWFFSSHQKFMVLASQVCARENFWTPEKLRRREALQWLLTSGALLFSFGYFWPILIEGGVLARVLMGATATPIWAIAALWTLALALATLCAGMQLEAPFKSAANASDNDLSDEDLKTAWRESTRRAARVMSFGIGAYFLFCVLGARGATNAIWLSRLPITLATCAAFLIADFGSAAFAATLPFPTRRLCAFSRVLWFHGLALLAIVLFARAALGGKTFSFDAAPSVLLSPFITLFALFRSGAPASIRVQPIVWSALGIQAAIGVLSAHLASRRIFRREEKSEAAALPDASTPALRPSRFRAGLREVSGVVFAPFELVFRRLEKLIGAINDGNEALVSWGEKRGNAVLIYELRRRIKKENWAWQWLGFFASQTILFFSIAQPWQLLPPSLWPMNNGITSAATFSGWGETVVYAVLFLMALVGVFACLGIGRAFDSDRANGTLVFLFLTPQTDKEILLGKWLSGILYVGGILSTGLLWLSIGVLVAALWGGAPQVFLIAACLLIALVVIVFLASTVNLFFAVRARKPTEGQGWALLFCLAIAVADGIMVWICLEVLSLVSDEFSTGIFVALATLWHGVLAYLAWRLALSSFARKRYGDLESSGKGAS